jgi:hypothetical protein
VPRSYCSTSVTAWSDRTTVQWSRLLLVCGSPPGEGTDRPPGLGAAYTYAGSSSAKCSRGAFWGGRLSRRFQGSAVAQHASTWAMLTLPVVNVGSMLTVSRRGALSLAGGVAAGALRGCHAVGHFRTRLLLVRARRGAWLVVMTASFAASLKVIQRYGQRHSCTWVAATISRPPRRRTCRDQATYPPRNRTCCLG